MNKLKFNIICYFRRKQLNKSFRKLAKAQLKKEKAIKNRVWIQNNPHIHLLNYPYYKIKKIILGDKE